MSPKILLEKKKRREERRTMAALFVFMLNSLEIVVERKKLFEGRALFRL